MTDGKTLAPDWATSERRLLLPEAEAGSAQVDLVAGAQLLAAAVAGGDVDGAAVAEDARAEFAAVIGDAVFAGRKRMCACLRETVPLASSAPSRKTTSLRRTTRCFGIGQLRQAADVGARLVEIEYCRCSALPLTTTRLRRRAATAGWAAAGWPYSIANARSPVSAVLTSTAKPRGNSQPAPSSASPNVVLEAGLVAESRLHKARAGPASARNQGDPHQRVREKCVRPRPAVWTLVSISSRMARCTSSSSSDCAAPKTRSVELAEAAFDGLFDFGKQSHG